MFPGIPSSEAANIGERNVERARRALEALRIPVVAEDTGGTHGRSALFNLNDGSVVVSSLRDRERIL
jgi:chemotaxis protein CheD